MTQWLIERKKGSIKHVICNSVKCVICSVLKTY